MTKSDGRKISSLKLIFIVYKLRTFPNIDTPSSTTSCFVMWDKDDIHKQPFLYDAYIQLNLLDTSEED